MVTKQNMGPTVWMLCRRSGLSPPPNAGPGSDSQYYQTRAEPPNRWCSGSSQTSRRRHGGSVHNISLHSWWFDFMKIFNRRDFFFFTAPDRKVKPVKMWPFRSPDQSGRARFISGESNYSTWSTDNQKRSSRSITARMSPDTSLNKNWHRRSRSRRWSKLVISASKKELLVASTGDN